MSEFQDAYLNRTILVQDKMLLGMPAAPVVVTLAFNIGLFMTLRSVLVFVLLLTLGWALIYSVCKDDPKGLAAWQLAINRRLFKNIDRLDPTMIVKKPFLFFD